MHLAACWLPPMQTAVLPDALTAGRYRWAVGWNSRAPFRYPHSQNRSANIAARFGDGGAFDSHKH